MKNKNEMYQKSTTCEAIACGVIVPAFVTAQLVGCSESAVKKVRNGFIGKTGRGKVCRKIVLTDELLRRAIGLGIEQVQKVINK